MTANWQISVLKWRIPRAPFIAYLCAFAFCVGAGALAEIGILILVAVCCLLALPVPLTMRLRDAGVSRWINVTMLAMFAGVLLRGAYLLVGGLASVSGAPGSGPDPLPATAFQRATEYGAYGVVTLMGLCVLYGVFAKSAPAQGDLPGEAA